MKNLKLIAIGSIVFLLLTFSNHIASTYPSFKIAVITFDSLMFFVLLRFAYRELKKIIEETSVKFVVYCIVASLVVLCLVIWLVA